MPGGNRNRNDLKAAVSLKPTPVWVTAHKCWKTRAYCTACRKLTRLEIVLSRWLCWSEPLLHRCLFPLGNVSGPCFLKATEFVSGFLASWLVLQWVSAVFYLSLLLEKDKPSESNQRLLVAVLSNFLSVLRSMVAVCHGWFSEKTATQRELLYRIYGWSIHRHVGEEIPEDSLLISSRRMCMT